jgi:hypothetical protein
MLRHGPVAMPASLLSQYGAPRRTLLHCGARSTVWRLDTMPTRLVVKLCHEAGAATREYHVLKVFAEHYSKDPRLRVIRPVALDAESNAVITEYLSFTTLRELGSVQHRLRRLGRAAGSFLDLLHRAGTWLRSLHDDSSLRDALSELTRTPRSSRPWQQLLDAARHNGLPADLVHGAGAALASAPLSEAVDPVGIAHGDFGTSNIACSGSALALVDLGDVAFEHTVHEIARTYSRLLAVPSLVTQRSIEFARQQLMEAYGGYPEPPVWRYWRTWALLELYGELVPAGWKRSLVATEVRRRCIRDLREVLG